MSLSKFKLLKLYVRNKRFLPATFFLAGFLFDILTLGRIDDLSNIIMQVLYLGAALATLTIELKNLHKSETQVRPLQLFYQYHDEIYHFLVGGLLSIYTLFFFKSASALSSLIFLLFMFSVLIINEFDSIKKSGKTFRMILFFICLTCFSFLITPLMLGHVGFLVFFLSLVLSAILSALIIWLWSKDNGHNLKKMIMIPSSILGIFTLLYLVKLIPPIPMALEKIGIYHKVDKEYPVYYLHHQKPWWKFWHSGDQDFLAGNDDKVYVFARIFSPGGFKDQVYLNWQVYQEGEWKSSDRIPMTITGGREKGFRGYAFKSNYVPGEWRVLVETKGGREIGRISFDIEKQDIDNSNFKVELDQ
ncbi:MAG: DUF2914 domain-containing protein [Deltaproteobacteria bacterium]|nr:MAG: DUF2914 domain-containing protein [Deltaproteobacteria bacterium]TNF27739.1 MAG: DUF2914 domain-containing protein [Deltaproteobacteria bacterium]